VKSSAFKVFLEMTKNLKYFKAELSMNHITMNKKEREQLVVFEKMKNNTITQTEASSQLGISTRWIRKKFKRYLENEAAGIIHKNRDRPSNKRWNENEKAVLIDLLQSDWHDFGPSFAAQKLKELKNINVSKETVRQTMIKGNLWQPKREKIKHRKRRERRAMIGGMTQFDGSKHKWFEERGEWSLFILMMLPVRSFGLSLPQANPLLALWLQPKIT